jgi:ribosomal protein S18 acetylase RimI-like enzyme
MLLEIYSKVRLSYVQGGITQVIRRIIKKITYFFYHSNNAFWYRLDLRSEFVEFHNNVNAYVEFNNFNQTVQYIKEYGYYYPSEIKTGVIEGHIYPSIKIRNSIIGYSKIGFSKVYIEDFKRTYQFPENVAYIYDSYIAPEWRGKKFGAFLIYQVCIYLRQRGCISVWAHIPPWNKASLATFEKIGFKRQKLISYYWVGGLFWTTKNPIKLVYLVERFFFQKNDN